MKIFIGNLSYDATEDDIREMLDKYGEYEELVKKEGFAFAKFLKAEDGKAAISGLNNSEIRGRNLRVERAQDHNDTNESEHLFVANIPTGTTEEDLTEFFSKYGKVETVKILPQKPSQSALSAFVDFLELDDAVKAHEDQKEMGGNVIRSDYNSRKRRRERRDDRGGG